MTDIRKNNVTIKDIATEVGISYATVSRALNDKPGVKNDIRLRILTVAKQMGYYPNAVARSLVTRETRTIALVIPDITNPFFPEVARGVEDAATRAGYNVFLCNTNWDMVKELSFLELFKSRRIDGLILASSSDESAIIDEFVMTNAALVILNSFDREFACHRVVTDNVRGGYLAGKHLLGLGHRRIGFIGGLPTARSTIDRYVGFCMALEETGLDVDQSLARYGSFTWESGLGNTMDLLNKREKPTAIFAANDLMALGVIQAADELGLEIPKDLAVIGFDDIVFSSYPRVHLTTIAQPKQLIGETAAKMIIDELHFGRKQVKQNVVLEPDLVVRKSCGFSIHEKYL